MVQEQDRRLFLGTCCRPAEPLAEQRSLPRVKPERQGYDRFHAVNVRIAPSVRQPYAAARPAVHNPVLFQLPYGGFHRHAAHVEQACQFPGGHPHLGIWQDYRLSFDGYDTSCIHVSFRFQVRLLNGLADELFHRGELLGEQLHVPASSPP